MDDMTRMFIVAFALCFFYILSQPAFAQIALADEASLSQIANCYRIGDVMRCHMPDGTIVTTIVK